MANEEYYYTYCGRNYTREEMISIGRAHPSRKYWGKRGAGMGLMIFGGVSLTPFIFLLIYALPNPDFPDYLKGVYIGSAVTFFAMFVIGVTLFSISFIRPSDEDYILYASVYLSKYEERNRVLQERNIRILDKYKRLLDNGAISQEEYEAKKNQLFGR